MSPTQSYNPRQICEQILQADRAKNIEGGLLRSEVAVADRLLSRGLELSDTYRELHEKLHSHHYALEDFLAIVLKTAAFWSPEKMEQARDERDQLVKVNCEIAKKAAELADLLEERSELDNSSDFSGATHYHICDVIDAAAKSNHLFKCYVKDELAGLRIRHELKYWPTPSAIVRELAVDAETAIPEASNALTEASTSGMRASLADFFKVLLAAIGEQSTRDHGRLPRDFRASDLALASLANCALDLGPDSLVDDHYVKRLRQRERQAVQ